MSKPTLLILAAGMGSRFGGLKQVMPFGPNGETLIDYSLYDAGLAGFSRAVFVIKPEMESVLREHLARSAAGRKMEIDFAFQSLDDLPEGFSRPEAREKPWGTGHAVFAARGLIDGPFGVIGADDFFGRDAFVKLYDLLCSQRSPCELGMVGYRLENTLSDSGAVSRGVCEVEDGHLVSVNERTHISRGARGIYYEEDGQAHALDGASIVSLNVWALHGAVFAEMEADFSRFLSSEQGDPLKREYYLPAFVDRLARSGSAQVRVSRAESRWYGVTHKSDATALETALKAMHEQGIYPKLVE